MKRIFLLMTACVLILASCDKEKVVSPNDLPATSTSYINTHFAGQQILQVVKERDDLKTTYKAYLNNGTKLEFNSDGEIIDIESNEALPESVIPAPILSYVSTNYPAVFIKEWELDKTTQDVKLSNGLTLEFDKNGTFLRIDD
ncbi:MAG: PepSY-like domain-containing protein [Chitinophagaceae bacterium]|nr:PepSY-like domain-containing protein [Chitinophagaceae bacterium]